MVSLHPVLVFSADFVLGPSRFLTWTSGVTRVTVFVFLDHLIGTSCDPRPSLVFPWLLPRFQAVSSCFTASAEVVTLNTVLASSLPLLGGKPQPLLISTIFDKTLLFSENDAWVPRLKTALVARIKRSKEKTADIGLYHLEHIFGIELSLSEILGR